jgi:hypothetical protein
MTLTTASTPLAHGFTFIAALFYSYCVESTLKSTPTITPSFIST